MNFRVTYIGAVGIRSTFCEADSADEIRRGWELLYPNLSIQSIEPAGEAPSPHDEKSP